LDEETMAIEMFLKDKAVREARLPVEQWGQYRVWLAVTITESCPEYKTWLTTPPPLESLPHEILPGLPSDVLQEHVLTLITALRSQEMSAVEAMESLRKLTGCSEDIADRLVTDMIRRMGTSVRLI
jgi:hypothetical protein